MKCLTIWEPWASAIVFGVKQIENRTWGLRKDGSPEFTGPLLIHAGLKREAEGVIAQLPPAWRRELEPVLRIASEPGAIIGMVNVDSIVPSEELGDCLFAGGPLCWQLSDPRAFVEPISWKGRQGLFDVPVDVVASAISNSQPGKVALAKATEKAREAARIARRERTLTQDPYETRTATSGNWVGD